MTINLTFDSDTVFMNAGLTPADIVNMRAACNYSALQFTTNYTDPINVNIFVTAVPGTGTLGMSSTFIFSIPDYATLRNAMVADSTTPDDATALGVGGSVPMADPIGGSHLYVMTRAQVKALGLAPMIFRATEPTPLVADLPTPMIRPTAPCPGHSISSA